MIVKGLGETMNEQFIGHFSKFLAVSYHFINDFPDTEQAAHGFTQYPDNIIYAGQFHRY